LLLFLFFFCFSILASENICTQITTFATETFTFDHYGDVMTLNGEAILIGKNYTGNYLVKVTSLNQTEVLMKLNEDYNSHSVKYYKSLSYVFFYMFSPPIIVDNVVQQGDNQIWRTDGTSAGTVVVYDQPGPLSVGPIHFVSIGDILFFTYEYALLRTDTKFNTIDLFGFDYTNVDNLYLMNGYIFFTALYDNITSFFKYNDATNTSSVLFNLGDNNYFYCNYVNTSDTLYIRINETIYYSSDLDTFALLNYSLPNLTDIIYFTTINFQSKQQLLFRTTYNHTCCSLYLYDGNATTYIYDSYFSDSFIWQNLFTVFLNELYFFTNESFVAIDSNYNNRTVKNITANGIPNTQTENFYIYDGILFFAANDDSKYGLEIWSSDGTENGTMMVRDLFHGPLSSNPTSFFMNEETLLYLATDLITGRQLWAINVTESECDLPNIIYCTDLYCSELNGSINEPSILTGYYFFQLGNISIQSNVVIEGATSLVGNNTITNTTGYFVGSLLLENGSILNLVNSTVTVRGCVNLKNNSKIVVDLHNVNVANLPYGQNAIVIIHSNCLLVDGTTSISLNYLNNNSCFVLENANANYENNNVVVVFGKKDLCAADTNYTTLTILLVVIGVVVIVGVFLFLFFLFKKPRDQQILVLNNSYSRKSSNMSSNK